MRLDEDFWLKLAMFAGFGFLGAFISHLNFLKKELKLNPKSKERVFNRTLGITLGIGVGTAIGLGFLATIFLPDISAGVLLGIGIVLGFGGARFLEAAQENIINNFARKRGFEIREISVPRKDKNKNE